MIRFSRQVLFALLFAQILISCGSNKSQSDSGSGEETSAESQKGEETTAQAVQTGPASKVGIIERVEGDALPQIEGTEYTLASQAAPTFSWKNGAGEEGSLEDYRGKVVLLNFWGTWCPPCRAELPDIVKLREELGPKGFEVLGVALERPITGKTVEEHLATFATANNLLYPMLIGNSDIVQKYGSSPYVPTTFVIDRKGNISNVLVGGKSEAEFRKAIEAVL
ncbi:MAG: TlpA family protein disulfide reductase [Ignavibacteriae bacterium]|nr:TlpA family protein disulfide reductase [Ignavibacteriota bacterium]MCB9216340.1 TlpA family protein disulfide reductase [Ignavibacteria bacterium]